MWFCVVGFNQGTLFEQFDGTRQEQLPAEGLFEPAAEAAPMIGQCFVEGVGGIVYNRVGPYINQITVIICGIGF